ncbi:helix-turn-helix domain-containing protein [Belliella marina]|uniref:Helix-turn-helix domain-containing protein n=1 Tax=Belliella marina TaxID=1644146 RepID=A0ABW4VKB5_9BACT
MNLKTFNFYQYVKEKMPGETQETFFYANNEMYRDLRVDFPFRTTHYGIGINYGKGSSLCRLGSADYMLEEGSLTTLGPGIITCWDNAYDLKNETVFFTDGLFRDIKVPPLQTLPFFMQGGNHMINVPEEELVKLKDLFQNIKKFNNNRQVLQGLVFSLVQYVQQLHSLISKKNNATQKEHITQKFRTLIARHFIESKEVSFYATQLHITPKYLSEVLVETTGKTAKELINEHIILETKSLLKQTAMTVSEIAYWLGYEEDSYFVRFFKKNTGKTPLAYRGS